MLIGRERETARIGALLDGLPRRGGALLVRGTPGIGKSALVAAAADDARRRGVVVLSAAGVQSETHLPFAGLHQLLQPLLGRIDALPERQREALRAAFGLREADDTEPFLIALAVLTLLSDAATRRSVLVAVDDVQWLDRPTTEVLAFLARRMGAEPVAVLMTIRDGHPSLLPGPRLPELELERLEPAAAEELLDVRAPGLAEGVRLRVLEAAAGNPLALAELPVALGGEEGAEDGFLPLTARLERAFAARLGELSPSGRRLLLAAAANDGPDLAEALAAAGATPADLTPAVTAGLVLIEEKGGVAKVPKQGGVGRVVRFRHPLVRSAVYRTAAHAERLGAHAALAEVLGAHPDRRAWHRAAAIERPDEPVAAELEAAAARARRRGAVAVAVTALRRAAEISEDRPVRARRLLRAAELSFELGRGDQVAALLALVEPEHLDETERARLTWLGAVFDEGKNEGPDRIRRLIATAETLEASGNRPLALNFVRAAGLRCWWTEPGWELRDQVLTLARRLAPGPDDPGLIMIMSTSAPVEHGAEVIERVRRLREKSLDGAEARLLGVAATAVGDYPLSRDLLETAIAGLRAQGRLGVLAQALCSQTWNEVFCGDWRNAVLAGQEGERLARESGQPRWVASCLAVLALLAGLRGEEEQGLALAAEGDRALGTMNISSIRSMLQHARGMIALCAGRHDEAVDYLLRIFDRGGTAYHAVWRHWVISELVEAAVLARRQDEVRPLLAELEADGRTTPAPLLHVGLRHARALLAADADAERLYQEALEADLSTWPTSRARLLLSHGTWLRRRRRVHEARASLRAARDAFDTLGLLPWGERARQELRAAGEASDLRLPSTLDRLTPQELQIARLAAAGLSNREIGQQLYLSPRTVSTHLYRLFPKLGINARSQLRDALPGNG
ncbi:LuxR family transcriptional regulator [Nonomuraea sp. NPDC050310]|uniref:LuxR family transcriptional regulator n=1 Tax=Nonomuraea sp. NPDC050310 TaxID=3154935 RepID=UPI0033D641B0